jgi:hypothetical protein
MEQTSKNNVEIIKLGGDPPSPNTPTPQEPKEIDLPISTQTLNNAPAANAPSAQSIVEENEDSEEDDSEEDDSEEGDSEEGSGSGSGSGSESSEAASFPSDDDDSDYLEEGDDSSTDMILGNIEDVMNKFFANSNGVNIAQVLTNINDNLTSIVKALTK